MNIYRNPARENWENILKRPAFDTHLLDEKVKSILSEIKEIGDNAIKKFSKQFDHVILDNLRVSEDEISAAEQFVSKELKDAIDIAYQNIYTFHEAQKTEQIRIKVSEGIECWQKPVPIEKVGLYIPGGTAPLFSTVLMLAIP